MQAAHQRPVRTKLTAQIHRLQSEIFGGHQVIRLSSANTQVKQRLSVYAGLLIRQRQGLKAKLTRLIIMAKTNVGICEGIERIRLTVAVCPLMRQTARLLRQPDGGGKLPLALLRTALLDKCDEIFGRAHD